MPESGVIVWSALVFYEGIGRDVLVLGKPVEVSVTPTDL